MALRNGRGFGGESLTIGGVKRDGTDATNDLTMLMLEASAPHPDDEPLGLRPDA